MEEFDSNIIRNVTKECLEMEITKTTNRSLLGNLNDLVNLYKSLVSADGGLKSCDLNSVTKKINRTPQKNLGWSNSVEIVREILDSKHA